VIRLLTPYLAIDNIRHLDVAKLEMDEDYHVEAGDLRTALLPFTEVETAAINSNLGHLHIFEDRWRTDREKILLPSLDHLIVQDLSGKTYMSADNLTDAWALVYDILDLRASLGFPISMLTISGKEISPDRIVGSAMERFRIIDAEGLETVGDIVERGVVDVRGWESPYWDMEFNEKQLENRVLAERITQLYPPLRYVLRRLISLNLPYKADH